MLKVATAPPNEPYREYKDVERVYSGSTEIDKILDKNGNVLFAVSKEVEGTPALTYKGKEETNLKNYRIYGNTETKTRSYSGSAPLSFPIEDGAVSNYRVYGNTVNSESVGDLVTDSQSEHYGKYAIPITNNSENTIIYLDEPLRKVGDEAEYVDYATQKWHRVRKNLFDKNSDMNTHGTVGSLTTKPLTYGFPGTINEQSGSYFMDVLPGEVYTISMETTGDRLSISGLYHSINPNDYTPSNRVTMDTIITVMITGENVPDTYTFTVPPNVVMVAIYYALTTMPTNFQIVKGSTALPYEPYIENTEVDVTLPALPAQSSTNSLSVDTSVQPSSVAVDVDEIVSCGDRTKNLLSNIAPSQTINGVTFTVNSDGSVTLDGKATRLTFVRLIDYIEIPAGTYTLTGAPSNSSQYSKFYIYLQTRQESPVSQYIDSGHGTTFSINKAKSMALYVRLDMDVTFDFKIYPMIRKADITDDTYEPYGYKIPVTLTADSAETTDIYLDEPLAKSGNNADYIDYATQKRHNSDGTESSVTLPALPTLPGTNTLTVGTEVQPSNVYLKGRIKEIT